jgi:hypothetical protein
MLLWISRDSHAEYATGLDRVQGADRKKIFNHRAGPLEDPLRELLRLIYQRSF